MIVTSISRYSAKPAQTPPSNESLPFNLNSFFIILIVYDPKILGSYSTMQCIVHQRIILLKSGKYSISQSIISRKAFKRLFKIASKQLLISDCRLKAITPALLYLKKKIGNFTYSIIPIRRN